MNHPTAQQLRASTSLGLGPLSPSHEVTDFIFNPVLSRTAEINDHGLDVQHPEVLLKLCALVPSLLGTHQTSGCLDLTTWSTTKSKA